MAADNWSRTASSGSATSLINTMVSRRRNASAGRVRVARGQRAFVPGVHRLHHVEGFAAPYLADDDAIGPHAERVANQRADRHRAETVRVRRPRFEAHDVVARQAQLGRVFDGDHPLARRYARRERIEQRRLARSGSPADDDVGATLDGAFEQLSDRRRAQLEQFDRTGSKAPDRDARTVHGQRRDDDVDPRSVGQSGIDDGTRAVDAETQWRDDPLDQLVHAAGGRAGGPCVRARPDARPTPAHNR